MLFKIHTIVDCYSSIILHTYLFIIAPLNHLSDMYKLTISNSVLQSNPVHEFTYSLPETALASDRILQPQH